MRPPRGDHFVESLDDHVGIVRTHGELGEHAVVAHWLLARVVLVRTAQDLISHREVWAHAQDLESRPGLRVLKDGRIQ